MRKQNNSANLMVIRTALLGTRYPYNSILPSLLMALSAIRLKNMLMAELGAAR